MKKALFYHHFKKIDFSFLLVCRCFSFKDFFNFIDEFKSDEIQDSIELGDKIMVIYRTHQANINTMLDGFKQTHNVSIAIASAITAYGRIHMTQFKNNPNFNLYYSDTDSAYVDKPLPKDMISSTVLGKMKLEHVLNDAILFHSFKKWKSIILSLYYVNFSIL